MSTAIKNTSSKEDQKLLQERLHELISRISSTLELVKNWPEASDASVHVESTTQLIAAIRTLIQCNARVEALTRTCQDCLIPLDLLDLMDHGANAGCGLNPECFCRGLLQEAQAQLTVLKRRKYALEKLGSLVQEGLDKMEASDKDLYANVGELDGHNNNDITIAERNNPVVGTDTKKRDRDEQVHDETVGLTIEDEQDRPLKRQNKGDDGVIE